MPLRVTRYQSARMSASRDVRTARQAKVYKMLGLNKPVYTLPHQQWANHVNNANHITNLRNPPGGVLMTIRRYLQLQITRGR